MRKFRFFGLLIFVIVTLLDFGSDIFQAYVYKYNGDHFYFGWTLTFILLPGDLNLKVDFLGEWFGLGMLFNRIQRETPQNFKPSL